jgi:integrase
MRNKVTLTKKRYRDYRHRVTWTQAGKRKSKWFKLKQDAEKFRAKTEAELVAKGNELAPITTDEHRAVHAFREAVEKLPEHVQSVTLSDAVATFIEGLESRHKSITCQEVSDQLENKLLAEGLSKSHRDTIGYRLKRFNATYGDWLTCDITTAIIDDFLTNLKLGLQTQLHYRRAVSQMFSHAIILKASTENPVDKAMRPKVKASETGILVPKDVAKLLIHADNDTLPGLAISFFAGVRRAEIERLDWADIDFKDKLIEIKAENAKTAERRLIPMSDNLIAWLTPFKKRKGPVVRSPAIWRYGQEQARKDAKLNNWPHNAGRHSFASYHLAHHNDPGNLAMALGHPDPSLLFKHYRKLVTPKAANLYWSITPTKAKKMIKKKSA